MNSWTHWKTYSLAFAAAGIFAVGSLSAGNVPEGMEKLEIKFPKPVFKGTPKNPPKDTTAIISTDPRPDFHAPKGVKHLSLNKPVSSSDEEPIIGDISLITDGDKEAIDGSYVELGPGLQWVQIDLEEAHEIWAIVAWHNHSDARIYRDVVVQVSNDPDFIDAKTIFNNDQDNSAGLGVGKEIEYFESNQGHLVEGKGVKARYVRLYSQGSTADDQNHYIEVDVYGK